MGETGCRYVVRFESPAGAISFDGLSASTCGAAGGESAQSDEDGLLLGLADPGATRTVITSTRVSPYPGPPG